MTEQSKWRLFIQQLVKGETPPMPTEDTPVAADSLLENTSPGVRPRQKLARGESEDTLPPNYIPPAFLDHDD